VQSSPQQLQLRLVPWHHQKQGYTGKQAAHLVNGRLPPGLLLFCNHQLISCSLQHSRTAHSSWEPLAQSQGDQLRLKLKLNLKLAATTVTVHNRQRCKHECCMTEAGRGAQEAFETSFRGSLVQQHQRCIHWSSAQQAHVTDFMKSYLQLFCGMHNICLRSSLTCCLGLRQPAYCVTQLALLCPDCAVCNVSHMTVDDRLALLPWHGYKQRNGPKLA